MAPSVPALLWVCGWGSPGWVFLRPAMFVCFIWGCFFFFFYISHSCKFVNI